MIKAERQAINTIVQGSASDLVKKAMIKIDKTIKKNLIKTDLVIQLHDELIFEVDIQHVNKLKEILKLCMENCMEFMVKMEIKIRTGKSWGDLND